MATNNYLSRQNYVCRDKGLVATSLLLSRQTRVCRDKKYAGRDKTFVAAKDVFVATNISRDKRFVAAKIFCHNKHYFVPSKHILYLWQLSPMIVFNMLDILNELGHGGSRSSRKASFGSVFSMLVIPNELGHR